jgi:peptide/nickel transport system ATP-binding protein
MHVDKVPGDLCRTELPDLVVGNRPGHTKRCHLANPDEIYEAEVLPEIAPDLVELTLDDSDEAGAADRPGHDAMPGAGSVAPEKR